MKFQRPIQCYCFQITERPPFWSINGSDLSIGIWLLNFQKIRYSFVFITSERKTLYELTEQSKLMVFRPTYDINKVTAIWKKNCSLIKVQCGPVIFQGCPSYLIKLFRKQRVLVDNLRKKITSLNVFVILSFKTNKMVYNSLWIYNFYDLKIKLPRLQLSQYG